MQPLSALKWLIAGSVLGAGVYVAPALLMPQSDPARTHALATQSPAGSLPDFTRLVEQLGPSVVNVTTRSLVRTPPDVAERHFDIYQGLSGLDSPQRAVVGLGSGFVLGDDGFILTNAHVVDGADEVYVRLSGGKRDLKATVVGVDKGTDIALLKVSARGLQPAPTGSSRTLKVGDWVAAIGSPFGFDNTITAGIISAKERHLSHAAPTLFLQSDVAINPGSSGGPLVNLRGEVVGINSKIYTRTGGYMGVSFAIPIETALKVGTELRKRGFIVRGFLGVETQPVSDELAAAFRLDGARGALVTAVQAGSPAGRAGLRPGDIVLAFAGKLINQPGDLARAVADTAPGARAEVEVWRKRERLHAAVVIDPEPVAATPAAVAATTRNHAAANFGLVLSEAPLDQCRDLKIAFGLIVNEIHRALSPASLQPGDVIVAVNDNGFKTRAEFNELVAETPGPVPVALLVMRDGRSRYVAVDSGPL